MSTNDLASKVAIVTGASREIGAATARLLAERGVKVLLVASSPEHLDRTTQNLIDEGLQVASIVADVGCYDDMAGAVSECLQYFGRLDILINNAGTIKPISHILDSNPVEWSRAIDVNLKGVYFVLRAALPQMISNGGGTVINLSSGAANHALEEWSQYCASKAALQRLRPLR